MWQTFIAYITQDSIHFISFTCLITLSFVGLCEIIFQIWNSIRKAKIADEYIQHIQIIAGHVNKRLEKRKEWGYNYDLSDLDKISESLNYVEINYQQAEECIESSNINAIPIYSLYSMLYYRSWDDNDVNRYCHQILVDYHVSLTKLESTFKRNLYYIFIPFTKLYRGFCVLFRFLTYPIKWFLEKRQRSFDSSGKWETTVSCIAEIATIMGVIFEFVEKLLIAL